MTEIPLQSWCDQRARSCHKEMEAIKDTVHLIAQAHTAAINAAKAELDHRLQMMNNLQDRMDRVAAEGVSRSYYEREHKELNSQIQKLTEWKSSLEGKASWTNLMAAVAIIIAAMSALFPIFHSMTPK